MKTRKIEMLDENDIKLCTILEEFGYAKNVAKLLLYFMHNKRGISKDIEQVVNLRQPEVSVGVRELHSMKMLDIAPIHEENKGKGRPTLEYSLRPSMKELFELVRERAMQKITRIQESLSAMDEVLEKMKLGGGQ